MYSTSQLCLPVATVYVFSGLLKGEVHTTWNVTTVATGQYLTYTTGYITTVATGQHRTNTTGYVEHDSTGGHVFYTYC